MMTPKQKAVSILDELTVDFKIDKWQVMQCATVLVNELIASHNKFDDSYQENTEEYYYWVEVKEELKKLNV
jgi:hypothetical protein